MTKNAHSIVKKERGKKMTTNERLKEFMMEVERVLVEDPELIALEIFMNEVDEKVRESALSGATEMPVLIPTDFRGNLYPIMRELMIAGYGWDRHENWLIIHWGH